MPRVVVTRVKFCIIDNQWKESVHSSDCMDWQRTAIVSSHRCPRSPSSSSSRPAGGRVLALHAVVWGSVLARRSEYVAYGAWTGRQFIKCTSIYQSITPRSSDKDFSGVAHRQSMAVLADPSNVISLPCNEVRSILVVETTRSVCLSVCYCNFFFFA